MDLRRRLVTYLSVLLVGLFLIAVIINLISLRNEVNNEINSSEKLVKVLLDIGNIERTLPAAKAETQLKAVLAGGAFRHVSISMVGRNVLPGPSDEQAPNSTNTASSGTPPPHGLALGLAKLLHLDTASEAGDLVEIGGQYFRISPNPVSEIDERLSDAVHFWITLLLFSGATLLVAWWSTHKALAPVRELEAGLQRLAKGETDAALPRFALREFSQVAHAINDLAMALNNSHEAQRQLSGRLIRVQEDERRDLAMNLHDEMGQTLTAISVTAAYLERNATKLDPQRVSECALDLRRDVRATGEQLRSMLKRLQPRGLTALELSTVLRELINGWQQREIGIHFNLVLPDTFPPMSDEGGMALYRIVQEALTNVVKHSKATQCTIIIAVTPDTTTLLVRIEDNGCGLPPSGIRYGCGLSGIAQRLCTAGGSLTFLSPPYPHSGLHLHIQLPLTLITECAEIIGLE